MSAFLLFCREKLYEDLEIIKSVSRCPQCLFGEMWNDMTPSDKKPYEEQAKKAKEEYVLDFRKKWSKLTLEELFLPNGEDEESD